MSSLFTRLFSLDSRQSILAYLLREPLVHFLLVGAALLLIFALLTSALVVSLHATWMRIVVRVAGSWVVAVGMLMLGWLAKSDR